MTPRTFLAKRGTDMIGAILALLTVITGFTAWQADWPYRISLGAAGAFSGLYFFSAMGLFKWLQKKSEPLSVSVSVLKVTRASCVLYVKNKRQRARFTIEWDYPRSVPLLVSIQQITLSLPSPHDEPDHSK